MTPDTWDSLVWFQQRALLEGLEDEEVISRDGRGGTGERVERTDLTSADDDRMFTSMGIAVESF